MSDPVQKIVSKCQFEKSIVDGTVDKGKPYDANIDKPILNDLLQAKTLNNLLFNEESYNDKKNDIEELYKVYFNFNSSYMK